MSNFALLPDVGSGSVIEETPTASLSGLWFSQKKSDMKTNIYKIYFFLRREKMDKVTGECPVYVRITVEKRTEVSLNIAVNPSKWDCDRQCVKGNSPLTKSVNEFLTSYRAKLHNSYTFLMNKGETITAETLKKQLLGKSELKKTALQLFAYKLDHIQSGIGKTYSISTFKKYGYCREHLANFIWYHYQATDLFLSNVDYYFVKQFQQYLLRASEFKNPSGKVIIKKANDHNSALKYTKMFRTVINEGLANKWLHDDPFALFKDKWQSVEQVYLDTDELTVIMTKEIPNERLSLIRDLFVFSCFTGLAFCDYQKLSRCHIVSGIEGSRWIELSRTKTDTLCRIPLLPVAEHILTKYQNHPECLNSGKLLPVSSNQKLNAYLKEIAAICGISHNLTTHSGRRTFATVAMNNGVPAETIVKIIGHKNFTQLHRYAKSNDTKTLADVKTLADRFEKNYNNHLVIAS